MSNIDCCDWSECNQCGTCLTVPRLSRRRGARFGGAELHTRAGRQAVKTLVDSQQSALLMHSNRAANAILILSLALLLSVTLLAGCGGTGTPSPLSAGSARQMLAQDGKEVGAYLADMEGILSSKASSIQQRRSATALVAREYEVFSPGTFENPTASAWNKVVDTSKRKKVIYGTLYGLANKKLVALNGRQFNASGVPENVSGAAEKYYVAVDNLNSLKDFEELLAEHTTGDGTRVNRSNPPPQGASVGLGAFGGAFVSFDWDHATGRIKLFRYDADPQLSTSGAPVTVPEMEQYFIGLAKARLAEAHIILSGK